jgi:hypothetical protein
LICLVRLIGVGAFITFAGVFVGLGKRRQWRDDRICV